DSALPDIVVVEAVDDNDMPVLRAVDAVVVVGRMAAARAQLARALGVIPLAPHELVNAFAHRSAA
ncbi:MAG: hypothetical protein JWN41_1566, partial [Thermoleophilia bacterium]|nr:hypothetical protein [Thermoleophilia bacterium]